MLGKPSLQFRRPSSRFQIFGRRFCGQARHKCYTFGLI
uniref:Uncharacterized protein n=1 Tax=Anguilla anguilla TaxID=7936 RepID=A0A0E9PF73_ANGAN